MFFDFTHISNTAAFREASLKAVRLFQTKKHCSNLWSLPVLFFFFPGIIFLSPPSHQILVQLPLVCKWQNLLFHLRFWIQNWVEIYIISCKADASVFQQHRKIQEIDYFHWSAIPFFSLILNSNIGNGNCTIVNSLRMAWNKKEPHDSFR